MLHIFLCIDREQPSFQMCYRGYVFAISVHIFQSVFYNNKSMKTFNTRLEQECVKEQLKSSSEIRSFMVDTGILSNNIKFPSHKY